MQGPGDRVAGSGAGEPSVPENAFAGKGGSASLQPGLGSESGRLRSYRFRTGFWRSSCGLFPGRGSCLSTNRQRSLKLDALRTGKEMLDPPASWVETLGRRRLRMIWLISREEEEKAIRTWKWRELSRTVRSPCAVLKRKLGCFTWHLISVCGFHVKIQV